MIRGSVFSVLRVRRMLQLELQFHPNKGPRIIGSCASNLRHSLRFWASAAQPQRETREREADTKGEIGAKPQRWPDQTRGERCEAHGDELERRSICNRPRVHAFR